jgi:hypothetical protein
MAFSTSPALAPVFIAMQGPSRSGFPNGCWPALRHDARNSGAQTVSGRPVIYRPIPNTSAAIGSTVFLGADANGTPPLTYQWLRDGQPLSNQTNGTLFIKSADWTDAGNYQVKVTNSEGEAISPIAKLSIGFRLDLISKHPERVQIDRALPVYPMNAQITLTVATGEPAFVGWRGPVTNNSPSLTLNMTNNIELHSLFETVAGDKLWEFKADGSVTDVPALGRNGTVFFGSSDSKITQSQHRQT